MLDCHHAISCRFRFSPFMRLLGWGNLADTELSLFGLQIAFNAAIMFTLGPKTIMYFLFSSFFAGSIHPTAGHFLAEHYVVEGKTETYSYYGPLNWLAYNVGYHNEHHDFPNIAWTKLPEVCVRYVHGCIILNHTDFSCTFSCFKAQIFDLLLLFLLLSTLPSFLKGFRKLWTCTPTNLVILVSSSSRRRLVVPVSPHNLRFLD